MRRPPLLVLSLCATLAACSYRVVDLRLGPFDFELDGAFACEPERVVGDRGALTLAVRASEGERDEDCSAVVDPVRAPRVVGAREVVDIVPRLLVGALGVASRDQEVLSARMVEGAVETVARAPGTATLVFFEELGGRVVDTVSMTVAFPSRVEMRVGPRTIADGETIDLVAATSSTFAVTEYGRDGRKLRAPGVVAVESGDASIVSFLEPGKLLDLFGPSATGLARGRIVARREGRTVLRFVAGGSVDVVVTAAPHD